MNAQQSLPFAQRVMKLALDTNTSQHAALANLAAYYGMAALDLEAASEFDLDFDKAGFAECQRRKCMIGRSKGSQETAVLISCEPDNLGVQQLFESILIKQKPRTIIRALVLEDDFNRLLEGAENTLRAMDSSVMEGAHVTTDEQDDTQLLSLSMASIEAAKNPTVKLVDSTLYDALKIGVSDIHFEVTAKGIHIKYRIDGVLLSVGNIDSLETANQVISRIKVLADLDISERRIPQDGRFRAIMDRREIDFRVSIMPNIVAEDAVLRILDRKHLTGQFEALSLDTLSFEEHIKTFIRKASHLPYGLFLVTGPTGSGKTTTLYAAISEINTGLDKIITIEDPIEYQLAGVLQIPVNEKKGLTFAKGLRSTLRHDPDKIMVGEIRDAETAMIAVQASLTGHQVFTTIHANNVFDVIGRFSNMGVDSYSLVAALSGIMAQRLVRTLCIHCAQEIRLSSLTPEEIESIQSSFDPSVPMSTDLVLKKACGCSQCRGTGFKGRAAIAETLTIDDQMKDLLVQHAPISQVKKLAREKGFKSLRDSAISMALRGQTTVEEINRVTPAEMAS